MPSRRAIGVGLIGCGTVGSGVLQLLGDMAEFYEQRIGAAFEVRRVLVRDLNRDRSDVPVSSAALTDDVEAFFATEMQVVIEMAGGTAVLPQVQRALTMGKHVITANKSLLAGHGPELFAMARKHGVAVAFEASCGGGIPIITALKFGLMANRIEALYGILNGTCNYILTAMTQQGKDYATALGEAQTAGFAEADPTMDVSGRDAAEKLAILASLAFQVRVDPETVSYEGIDGLDLTDIRFGAELGYDTKLLAIAQRCDADGRSGLNLRVRPCLIHADQPLAAVHGPFNALLVYGHATGQTMYYGRGAGSLPTASAVVSDLLNVASGWYPHAFAGLNIWPDRNQPAPMIDLDHLPGRFYLRVMALDVPGVMARITGILGQAGISLAAVVQHESAAGQQVPVVVMTHQTSHGAVRKAIGQFEQLKVITGRPVCLHVLETPEA